MIQRTLWALAAVAAAASIVFWLWLRQGWGGHPTSFSGPGLGLLVSPPLFFALAAVSADRRSEPGDWYQNCALFLLVEAVFFLLPWPVPFEERAGLFSFATLACGFLVALLFGLRAARRMRSRG